MAVWGTSAWKAPEGRVPHPSTAAGLLRGPSPADYGQSCCIRKKCRQGVPECQGSQDFQAAWLAGEMALELGQAALNQEPPDQRTAATKQQFISGTSPFRSGPTYFQCRMQGRGILLPCKPGSLIRHA